MENRQFEVENYALNLLSKNFDITTDPTLDQSYCFGCWGQKLNSIDFCWKANLASVGLVVEKPFIGFESQIINLTDELGQLLAVVFKS